MLPESRLRRFSRLAWAQGARSDATKVSNMATIVRRSRVRSFWRRRQRLPAHAFAAAAGAAKELPAPAPATAEIRSECGDCDNQADDELHAATLLAYQSNAEAMEAAYSAAHMLGEKGMHRPAMRAAADALQEAGERDMTPRRILDVGSAFGADAIVFAQMRPGPVEVIGIDACKACTEWAEQHLRRHRLKAGKTVRFITADVADLGSSEELDRRLGEPFDLVFSAGMLHHLSPTMLLRVLIALRARTHPKRGVLVMTMIAFGGHSLMPRGKGGRQGRLRGLHPKHAQHGDVENVLAALHPIILHCGHTFTQEMKRAIAREVDPWSNVPREQRTRTLSATLPGMVDEHSLADDGGGLGAELITADEVLGIPGRRERHYTPEALRDVLERAGWCVKVVRYGQPGEDSSPGKSLVAIARP